MRQINIQVIVPPDPSSVYIRAKQWSVWLGNGSTYYFSSVKKATTFLVQTNRFLNSELHELNYWYGMLFNEFRHQWFYLDEGDDQHITRHFETLDGHLKNSIRRSRGVNGNHFAFSFLLSGTNQFFPILRILSESMERHKNFAGVRRLLVMSRQLKGIKERLRMYDQVPGLDSILNLDEDENF